MYMETLIKNNPDEYSNKKDADESKLQVTLAELPHDIGHGPLSTYLIMSL
jgi:HD superfamily phosphohydrolase